MNDSSNKFSIEGNARRVPQYGQSEGKRPTSAPGESSSFKKLLDSDSEKEKGEGLEETTAAQGGDHSPRGAIAARQGKDDDALLSPFALSQQASSKKLAAQSPMPVAEDSTSGASQQAALQQAAKSGQLVAASDQAGRAGAGVATVPSKTPEGVQKQPVPDVPAAPQSTKGDKIAAALYISGAGDEATASIGQKEQLTTAGKDTLPSPLALAGEASRAQQSPTDKEGGSAFGGGKSSGEGKSAFVAASSELKDVRTGREVVDAPNMSALPGVAAAPITTTAAASVAAPAEVRSNLQEIYRQLAEKINVIRNEGKTETVIVLGGNTGAFAGARLVVTGFDSARDSFNVTFENLRVQAQALLDQPNNRAHMLEILTKGGYNVPIFTTTTYNEPRINIAESFQDNKQRDQDGERDSQERGQRQPRGGQA